MFAPLFLFLWAWGQLFLAGVLVHRLVHWGKRRPGFFVPLRTIAERTVTMIPYPLDVMINSLEELDWPRKDRRWVLSEDVRRCVIRASTDFNVHEEDEWERKEWFQDRALQEIDDLRCTYLVSEWATIKALAKHAGENDPFADLDVWTDSEARVITVKNSQGSCLGVITINYETSDQGPQLGDRFGVRAWLPCEVGDGIRFVPYLGCDFSMWQESYLDVDEPGGIVGQVLDYINDIRQPRKKN